jgi:hypothetical protein
MHAAYAILKVLPERYAQLPAGFLQADEGVVAPTAQIAPRAGTDLALLRPFPDVTLWQVVVQGNLRMIQDQQEVAPLLVDPLQGHVQIDKARPPSEKPVRVLLQARLPPNRFKLKENVCDESVWNLPLLSSVASVGAGHG